jgi:pimeloyl-ACP methyl ester carboxylesterase
MSRVTRFSLCTVAAVLLVAVGVAPPAAPTTQTCGRGATKTGSFADGATYLIQCPATWNGTLFLYSHGYVIPGLPNKPADTGDPVTGRWLLGHGYALAGSSYATTGWAVRPALLDQMATLNVFDRSFGVPARTIAWGHSLGGMITAGLVQEHPDAFAGALPFCGVLAGGVATWNTALDAAVAFDRLFSPAGRLRVVDITDPAANLAAAEGLLEAAQGTPQGRARIALVAALGDTPGWFFPGSPPPAANDFATQEENQFQWASAVDFPFLFDYRAQLEAEAGGNPSWDTGVDFSRQLARSADRGEVAALYQAAGLNLGADLSVLAAVPRVSATPRAVRYLEQNISFNGLISVPVLTVHTTGDGLVVPENEQAYRAVVRGAGDGQRLRQLFVARAGHCAFTPAETIVAIQALLRRVASGRWDDATLTPSKLNRAASALGRYDNEFGLTPADPAFTQYEPGRYPRPSIDPRPSLQHESSLRRGGSQG